ncbi:MAG: ROK family transcriptional regulator, partial [Actinomycetota bacterium]
MSQRPRRGADPALLREINAVATLRALHDGEPMTLTKIVDATGLARKTAEAAVERLVSDGLAVELPPSPEDRSVGRPARSFQFRAEAGYVLGMDIGVHTVSALLADLRGTVRARSESGVPRTAGRSQRVAAALRAAADARSQAGVEPDKVWATTAGTPGIVEGSAYVSLCHVIPEWSEFSLADELADGLPGPVQIENDTNLSAVAERWCGAARDVDSMVWVLTGRRSKAGVLIDGRLYRGADGAAGEIGWLPELGWPQLSEQTLSYTGAERTEAGEAAATTINRALAGDAGARRELDTYAAALAPG